jgi:hypothetical protein
MVVTACAAIRGGIVASLLFGSPTPSVKRMNDSHRTDVPRRRVIFGHGVLAVAAFLAAFALLIQTGSEFALVLLLPAFLFLVRTLVGIRRRRERHERAPTAGSGGDQDP